MFYFEKPSGSRLNDLLNAAADAEFSYSGIGQTQDWGKLGGSHQPQNMCLAQVPAGYRVDHNRVKVGQGEQLFTKAKEAIRQWQMFNLSWVEIVWASSINGYAPIEVGTTVGVLAKLPVWSLNPCRIVYTVDGSTDTLHRFGFGYGTLAGHAAKGEERFQVEWHQADDSVWYDILAFSQPNHLLAKTGYPMMRLLQKRFARDSKAAMVKACGY